MRDAARLALSDDWTMETGLAALAGEDIRATVAAYEASMLPLQRAEDMGAIATDADGRPQFGPQMTAVRTWLKPLGMKIAPSMSPEQCAAWLTAVAMALSDFPARVIVKAAQAAIHIPMSFLNEVDGHVRKEAEAQMQRHATALARLKRMHAEIERAAEPKLPPSAGWENGEAPRLTPEEIRRTPMWVLKLGIAAGDITQEEVDAAKAVEDQEAKAA
ncbi:hypothetical protein [Sphingomonas sp. DBB INV C78]|uniref:hypothetical protein n=1 Tax=Sphingomonas sp. DBB INV C78 TaxID=3349434 RepID=UPI0036D2BD63